jgi:hypothetical protein
LFRLAGLLELSDEEFSGLRKSEREFSGVVRAELSRGERDLEINAVSLGAYLGNNSLNFLTAAAETAGFVITNIEQEPSTASSLISVCSYVGIKTIGELEDEVMRSRPWAAAYLKAQNVATPGSDQWLADLALIIELIVIRLRHSQLTVEKLIASGWDKGLGEAVLREARKAEEDGE